MTSRLQFALLLALSMSPLALARDLTAPEKRLISLFERSKASHASITTGQRRFDPWLRRAEILASGSGSGFYWGAEGHMVTRAHVIQRAVRADVHMADGRVLPARLVGTTPQLDLAVLQVSLDGVAAEPVATGEGAHL